METALYIIGGIVLLISILAMIAPKSYDVSRSIEIGKPSFDVFTYLKLLKNQDEWSPWAKKDPNMKKTYTGKDGEVGFISRWEGNKNVGIGEQEITRIVKDELIESQLRFLKPWKSTSDAYMKVDKVTSDVSKVTWGFSGESKFPFSIVMLFMNMDKAVGKDFEEGLASLKERLEKN